MTYHQELAIAYIKGYCFKNNICIDNIKDNELIHEAIKTLKLNKLHHFKIKDLTIIPRVKKVLDIIKSLDIQSVVDFGSQRGALLWTIMNEFPKMHYTAVDIDIDAVRYLNCVKDGGINLDVIHGDITNLKLLKDKSADLV